MFRLLFNRIKCMMYGHTKRSAFDMIDLGTLVNGDKIWLDFCTRCNNLFHFISPASNLYSPDNLLNRSLWSINYESPVEDPLEKELVVQFYPNKDIRVKWAESLTHNEIEIVSDRGSTVLWEIDLPILGFYENFDIKEHKLIDKVKQKLELVNNPNTIMVSVDIFVYLRYHFTGIQSLTSNKVLPIGR